LKKILIIALIIILSLSLAATAIANTSETTSEAIPFTGTNPNNLRTLLESGDAVLSTRGNLGIFVQHSPFVVPAGSTLYVETTLNIQGNAELIIEGRIVVLPGGRINNQGSSGGTITIADGGILTNNGHVENVTNSRLNNNGTIINNARFEVRAGVTFTECHESTLVGNLNINRDAIRITCCVDHDWVEHIVPPTAGTHVTRVTPVRCPHNTGVNNWTPGIHPNPSWNPNLPPAGRDNALENFPALTNIARPAPELESGEVDPLNPLRIGGGGGDYLSCPQFCPLGANCPDLFPVFTGGGTRGYTTMKCTDCDTCWGMYTYGYSPYDWGFSHNTYWRGGTGVDNVPYNPFRFTFRHHCDFGAVWTQPTVAETPNATWENRERFGVTTFNYEYCMDGDGCGKHIDDASPADLFLNFRMPGPGRDRGQPVGTVGGSSPNNVGNWALVPDEVIDRFIYAFNIVFEPIFEWKTAPLSPQWYELDMRDSIAWWSSYTNGVALSWLNRGAQHSAIVSYTADGDRYITSTDPGWRSTHHWDMDAQTHELVHAGQRYGGASLVPGGGSGVVIWIHENFTDLLRPYMGIFNREAGFTIPDFGISGQSFTQTYRVGAAFFRWVERHSEYWTNPDSRIASTFPENYVSNFNRDLHNAVRANTAAGPTGRGGSFIQGTGTGANRTPQIIELTGFSIDELWAQYLDWSAELGADLQNYWRLGYASLEEAANARAWHNGRPVDRDGNPTAHAPARGGRPNTTGAVVNARVNMNPTFVDGGFGFGAVTAANPRGAEGATRLFDYTGVGGGVAGTLTKYCQNMDTHGSFWAIWRYDEPFVATRLIFGTSNDSGTMGPGRRLGNGWTLSGSNDGGETWTVIYTGLTNDYSNYNRMFFVFDLLGNTTAYQYYKLYCDTQGFCDWRGDPETRTRQLSVVALAYSCCQLFPDCEVCELCQTCVLFIDSCDICDAVCNCECVICPVCGMECDANCVPCAHCEAECNDRCRPCAICDAYCIFTCDCHVCDFDPCLCFLPTGTFAMVTGVTGGNIAIGGVNHTLGTAFVTGRGMVNIAIPPGAAISDGGLLESEHINIGQIIRVNEVVEHMGTTFPLFTLANGVTGTQNLIMSSAMQGIRREATWTNGTVNAAVNWLFNSTSSSFIAGRQNLVVGRVTSYNDGVFTIGASVRGTVETPVTYTLPDNMDAPVWIFPQPRGGSANPQTRIDSRTRLNEADIRAANLVRAGNDPHAIYAVVWHAPGNVNEVLSVSFIVDFNPDGHALPLEP